MDTTMKKLPPKPVDTKKKVQHWTIAIVTIQIGHMYITEVVKI